MPRKPSIISYRYAGCRNGPDDASRRDCSVILRFQSHWTVMMRQHCYSFSAALLRMIRILSGIARHPLNRHRPFAAIGRFVAWQLGTRLLGAPVAMPFIGSTRLLVRRGMVGATGNVYYGLQEFEDMAFVVHALRQGDVFVDVGANVGSYTVLAAGVSGARCIALEPVPSTFDSLLDNVRLNDLTARVECHNVAAGS